MQIADTAVIHTAATSPQLMADIADVLHMSGYASDDLLFQYVQNLSSLDSFKTAAAANR
jgi:hypothetical protein